MTDLQFRALQFLQGANDRSCEEIFRKLWSQHRFNTLDTGNSKGGPSRIQFVVNHYMGKLRKKGWVFQIWDDFRGRSSQDFSLTSSGVSALRKEREARQLRRREDRADR